MNVAFQQAAQSPYALPVIIIAACLIALLVSQLRRRHRPMILAPPAPSEPIVQRCPKCGSDQVEELSYEDLPEGPIEVNELRFTPLQTYYVGHCRSCNENWKK